MFLPSCAVSARFEMGPYGHHPGGDPGNHGRHRSGAVERLRGRRLELATLSGMLADTAEGRSRHLAIDGPSGIGKSALARSCAPWMRELGGHFVHGKFDQYQSSMPLSAPLAAAAELIEVMMAGTMASVAVWRDRLDQALRSQAGALARLIPSLAMLLGLQPSPADAVPAFAPPGLPLALKTFFAAAAGLGSPLVIVLDDIQWADSSSLDFIDSVLNDTDLRFLMLVVTLRDDATNDARPVASPERRFASLRPGSGTASAEGDSVAFMNRPQASLRRITLAPLGRDDVVALLSDAMQVPPDCLQAMLRPLMDRTLGNPFHAIEMARDLSRHAALATPGSIEWMALAQARLGTAQHEGLATLLGEHLRSLPPMSRTLLQIAASLGNEFSFATFAAVTSGASRTPRTPRSLARHVRRLVEAGALTVSNPGSDLAPAEFTDVDLIPADLANADLATRRVDEPRKPTRLAPESRLAFCHDRMQQVAYNLVDEGRRWATHLHVARALARARRLSVRSGDSQAAASGLLATGDALVLEIASHYVKAVAVLDEADRTSALDYFVAAGRLSHRSAAHEQTLHYLESAHGLLSAGSAPAHRETLIELRQLRHVALCSLGRYEEADLAYRQLLALRPGPMRLLGATSLQVAALFDRQQRVSALELGLDLLRRLDVDVPADFDHACAVDIAEFTRLCAERPLESWVDAPGGDAAADPLQRFIARLSFVAMTVDAKTAYWLTMQPCLAWFRQGFTDSMCGPMGSMAVVIVALTQDYTLASRALRLSLAAAEQRAPAPDHSGGHELQACHSLYAMFSHWFEPLEDAMAHSREAMRLVRRNADPQSHIHDHVAMQPASLDIVSHLDQAAREIDGAFALATRLRSSHYLARFITWRQFVRALRGQTRSAGSFDDAGVDEASFVTEAADPADVLAQWHVMRAWSAAIFGDDAAVVLHASRAAPLLVHLIGSYTYALGVTVAALSAALQLATVRPEDTRRRATLLAELDRHERWMGQRAADAPRNFEHLHHYLAALRCAALGQLEPALRAFDQAARTAIGSGRELHAAFLLEQAARFHLARGLDTSGHALLQRAFERHAAWGSSGKAEQMQQRWPHLATSEQRPSGQAQDLPPEFDVDRLAILKVSRALSSVTDMNRLVKR
ncbi:MAG: putative ATPase, partial [Rhizobacter sp.]|nr:putative ATPase [Rhizobacter sp.]